ncbi:MAG: hypothetical protein AAB932_05760 [Patescibacteria group bacterium]
MFGLADTDLNVVFYEALSLQNSDILFMKLPELKTKYPHEDFSSVEAWENSGGDPFGSEFRSSVFSLYGRLTAYEWVRKIREVVSKDPDAVFVVVCGSNHIPSIQQELERHGLMEAPPKPSSSRIAAGSPDGLRRRHQAKKRD